MTGEASWYEYWVGMDTEPEDEAELAEFHAFYSQVHQPEVLAKNGGFVRASRYELAVADPDGWHAPRWLAVYEVLGDPAVSAYLARADTPRALRVPSGYTPGTPMFRRADIGVRALWRQVAETRESSVAHDALFLVGLDPPDDATADELAEFDAFYTGTHLHEVEARGSYLRASRFELVRDLADRVPRMPRFVAQYEADSRRLDELVSGTRSLPAGAPAISPGPPVWQRHQMRWRVTYRRMGDAISR